ncbi:MAG: hypothetical protein QW199_02195 [Candidatus Pacearchaeota archaeon]
MTLDEKIKENEFEISRVNDKEANEEKNALSAVLYMIPIIGDIELVKGLKEIPEPRFHKYGFFTIFEITKYGVWLGLGYAAYKIFDALSKILH